MRSARRARRARAWRLGGSIERTRRGPPAVFLPRRLRLARASGSAEAPRRFRLSARAEEFPLPRLAARARLVFGRQLLRIARLPPGRHPRPRRASRAASFVARCRSAEAASGDSHNRPYANHLNVASGFFRSVPIERRQKLILQLRAEGRGRSVEHDRPVGVARRHADRFIPDRRSGEYPVIRVSEFFRRAAVEDPEFRRRSLDGRRR